jgi:hypothetical protein
VYNDLQPYFCSFQDCPEPDRLYGSRRAWFTHEMNLHRRMWTCIDSCSKTFTKEVEFKAHLQNKHKDLCSSSGVEDIANAREHQIPSCNPFSCPFCSYWSQSAKHEDMRRHIGRHMSRIALWSLPTVERQDQDQLDSELDIDLFEAHSSQEEENEEEDDRKGAMREEEHPPDFVRYGINCL